jgi:hypothetical protein
LEGDGGYIHLRSQSAKTLSFPGRKHFTIELLVKPAQADVPIVGKYNTLVSGEWKLYIDADMRLCAYREAPPREIVRSSSKIALAEWSHVAVTYNGEDIVMVHNGEEVARCASGECVSDPSTSVHIGTWRVSGEIGNCFVGSMKELRFWSRALSAAELSTYAPALLGSVPTAASAVALPASYAGLAAEPLDAREAPSTQPPSHRRVRSLQGDVALGAQRRGSALTGAMLQRLKSSDGGLLAYFPMTEGSGRTIRDRLDVTNSGFLISDTSGWVDKGFVGEGRTAESGVCEALRFDGSSGGFVQLPSTARSLSFLGSQPFTIEAWVCPSSADVPIVGKFNSLVRGEYKLWIDAESRVAFYREAEPREVIRSADAVALQIFSHVAVVYDGATVALFINAQEQARAPSGACDAKGDASVATTVHIGSWLKENKIGKSFNGLMREMRIWDVARTREELREFMVEPIQLRREKGTGKAIRIRPLAAGEDAPSPGRGASASVEAYNALHLKAYWPLRASASSGKRYVVDKSMGGNHGYLMGDVGWVTIAPPNADGSSEESVGAGASTPPLLSVESLDDDDDDDNDGGGARAGTPVSPTSSRTSTLQRVLVTGGAGYIGSHICLELLQRGYLVSVIDNYDNSCAESLRRVVEVAGRPISYHRVDLLDVQGVEAIFEGPAFDAVIHCAGLKSVNQSVSQPLHYYHNNITGTINLLQIMARCGCRNLIFSSSATVYGLPESVPVREDAPHGPTNPYGQTKDMIEQILTDLHKSDDRWNIIMLRCVSSPRALCCEVVLPSFAPPSRRVLTLSPAVLSLALPIDPCPRPTPSSLSLSLPYSTAATLTPSGRTRAASSGRTQTAFRATCCRTSRKSQCAAVRTSACTAATTRRATERESATSSTSSTWRGGTSPR